MPRKKRAASPFELLDDDFDEDASSQSSRTDNPPIQRNAANARERARMRVLSSAFGRLKTKLPNIPSDTKLSKLDTLRLATMYIKQLKTVVEGGTPLAANADHDIDGTLNDTPSCYLQLHSGAQSMNWPFGLHHQVNNSSTRSHSSCPTVSNGVSVTTSSWCQTEGGNISKQPRYETENYHHHQQQNHLHQHQHHHEQQSSALGLNHDHPSYLLTSSSSASSLTAPQNSSLHQEVVWYSETPSPDLSNSSSSGGVGGGGVYDSSHHQRHSLIEHLSHIQLTPPPHSSASHPFQQHHHHHQHHTHPHQNHNQYSHHHDHHHLQHVQQNHQSLHQSFANTSNLAAASIR